MATNREVLLAWVKGSPARATNLSTDGDRLYSYALLIAQGNKVYDYTSKGLGFKSQTTSGHVGLAKRFAMIRYNERSI